VVDLATIKADLPDWPDDVIKQWLLKLANRGPDTGWPPPEDLDGNAWKYILGGRPPSWWKKVTWKLEDRDVNFEALSRGTKLIVNDMLGGDDTAEPDARLIGAANYVAKHGSFPKPLVAMQLEDGLSVLDGNHRVAALCACQAIPDTVSKKGGTPPLKSQKVWMGTHAAGEVPFDEVPLDAEDAETSGGGQDASGTSPLGPKPAPG